MQDKDTTEGQAHQVIGDVKEKVGHATGDTETKAEGMAEKAKGAVQEGVGKVKDAVRGIDKGVSGT